MWGPVSVTCRHCGAEIADKALICYRCGTATTEAKYQPAPIRPARSGPGAMRTAWIVLVVLALLMAAAYFLLHVG